MSTHPTPPVTPWRRLVGIGFVGAVLVSVLILAFLWPSKTSAVQDIPVSISGPAASVSAVETVLAEKAPGTFDFVEAADRDAALSQIQSRETSGAIVLAAAPQAPEVLTATAGSPVVSQLLTGVATQLQAQLTQQATAAGGDASGVTVTVTDVVPLSSEDPNGSALAAASFPLTMGGLVGGVLMSLLVVGTKRRLVALLGFAAAAGLALALILQGWFGFLQGDYGMNALGIGLVILATSSFIAGCSAAIGKAGIGVAAAFTMLFANPLSAAATPWQFLAAPWGAIGQWLAPGAGNWLVRSLSYFPDAANTQQWWTLAGWAALGFLLLLVGHVRQQRAAVSVASAPSAPAATPAHSREPALSGT